jgi:hypothetical protein
MNYPTDDFLTVFTGVSNEMCAGLLNDPNKSGRYINRTTWKEERFDNEHEFKDFESEEFQNKNENYNDFIEENSIEDALCDLVNGHTILNVSQKMPALYLGKNEYWFYISGLCNVINNLYLEIELDKNFDEMTIKEKYAVLNSTIKIEIGKDKIDTLKIMTCLCNQIFCGNNIKEDNNIIQVPLYNFDTFVDKKTGAKGFRLFDVNSQSLKIILEINNDIKHFKYKIVVNGQIYKITETMLKSIESMKMYILLQNQYDATLTAEQNLNRNVLPVNNKTTRYKLSFNRIVKYILIYFTPNKDVDFWLMNEDYPLISKAILIIFDKNVLEFENEDLLDIEMFGIKIYLLPLCKEFSNFENMSETFKDPLKKMTSNGITFVENYGSIEIEYENETPDLYNINFIGVNLNCMMVSNGMCAIRYRC